MRRDKEMNEIKEEEKTGGKKKERKKEDERTNERWEGKKGRE